MSQALFNARKKLASVSTLLKQGNLLSAVQATHAAVKALMGSALIKSEGDEFRRMITDACSYLDNDSELRKLFPLAIEFKEGKEQSLLDTLTELMGILESEATKNLPELQQELFEKKKTTLDKGQEELDAGKHDAARKTFSELTAEFHEDADLASDVGERFMRSGLYEDASQYLESSAQLNPGSAHVFNKLGIALRKMKRFDVAEQNFHKALQIEKNDPNLHFNLGRLYLDWKKWPEVIAHAEAALALDGNFAEARQMGNYAKRMLEDAS